MCRKFNSLNLKYLPRVWNDHSKNIYIYIYDIYKKQYTYIDRCLVSPYSTFYSYPVSRSKDSLTFSALHRQPYL